MNGTRLLFVSLALIALAAWLARGYAPPGPGSDDDRHALYHDLVEKTLAWQASAPIKDRALGLDFARDAEPLEAEFLTADTNDKLVRALIKLSNLRRDRHLRVEPAPGGIRIEDETQEAPIRFLPDYGDSQATRYFVSTVADEAELYGDVQVQPGDVLNSVSGMPVSEYRRRMDPYLRYSTRAQGDWEFAIALNTEESIFGPELDLEGEVTYGLTRADGSEYEITMPFLEPDSLRWPAPTPPRFHGFRPVLTTTCYALYEPEDGRRVVLVDWRQFDMVMIRSDLDSLAAWAQRHDRLDHDVIVDATRSEGGAYADLLVRTLVARPFQGMKCNLRISNLREALTEKAIRHYGDPSPQVEWYRNDVAEAAAQGLEYTPPVPLRLHGERDGVVQPAAVHFRGRLVCLLGPPGGSSRDQFAALVIDNQLGHAIGMPTSGYSNAWEWDENVKFPNGQPVAHYAWSVGYSIRPNGEILEGNPAVPQELVPLTRANFSNYHEQLLARALAYLSRPPG